MTQDWTRWQSRLINQKFELREYLGGTPESAVFTTSLDSPRSPKAVIKLVSALSTRAELQLSFWEQAKKLSHPHIIRLFETGRCSLGDEHFIYVVMEYAEEALSTILPTRALTADETREMLDPTLEALSYLHGQGFVHGHIKPANIMATGQNLKVSSDRIVPAGQGLIDGATERSVYLAPEAASGHLTPAADIWALGVTLIEALSQQKTILRSAKDRKNIFSALPPPFRGIIEQCLRTDPQQRCTVEDIRKELHPEVDRSANTVSRQGSPRLVPEPAKRTAPESARRSNLSRIMPAIVVLALLASGIFFLRHRGGSPQALENSSAAPAAAVSPVVQPVAAPNTTAPGKVITRVLPDVSKNDLRTIHGTIRVKVRADVDAAGNVQNTRLEARGSSRFFAQKAEEASRQWKFSAPLVNGTSAPSKWILEFLFRRTSVQTRNEMLVR